MYNYIVFLAAFGALKGEGSAIPFSRLFYRACKGINLTLGML